MAHSPQSHRRKDGDNARRIRFHPPCARLASVAACCEQVQPRTGTERAQLVPPDLVLDMVLHPPRHPTRKKSCAVSRATGTASTPASARPVDTPAPPRSATRLMLPSLSRCSRSLNPSRALAPSRSLSRATVAAPRWHTLFTPTALVARRCSPTRAGGRGSPCAS